MFCRRGIVNVLNAGASAIELDLGDVATKGLIEDLRDGRYQISDRNKGQLDKRAIELVICEVLKGLRYFLPLKLFLTESK